MRMKHSSPTLDRMEHHPTSSVRVETLEGDSPETAILRVTGPLTIHNFFEFQDLARQQTAPVLVIDLTGVPYIDSAALGSLVGIHVSRENAGKKYAIAGANERLQNLFSLTGISGFLVTFPAVAAAEAAFA